MSPNHNHHGLWRGRFLRRAAILLLALAATSPLALAADRDHDASAAANPAPSTTSNPGANDGANAKSIADPDTTADPSANETLLLDVEVNGRPIGKIGEFVLRRGTLMARPSELRDLGFKIAGVGGSNSDQPIPLSDLPGLTSTLDLKNQVLHIVVSDSQLAATQLLPDGRQTPQDHREIESGTGMTLNYDVVDTIAGTQNGLTGTMDMRAFSPMGVASSGWLGYAGATSGSAGRNKIVRLDSTYSFADVNSLRRYSLGDLVTNGLSWTRPVRVMGFQIRSDFSTRPDLITFPLPSLAGSAAVPSSVDILADGNLVASSQIAPGPFEVPQIPVVSGAGTISMTVTNALGQQVTLTQPFYASSALLAKGLQTFAGQVGIVRRNWGVASYDYGKFAALGSYRRGLTPKFTLEGGFEGAPGTFMAGGGGVKQIGTLGVLNFSAGASFGSGGPGMQASAGAQHIGRRFSIGALASLANRNFRDVASVNGAPIPRKQLSGFTSLSLRRYGTLGAAYAGSDQAASPLIIQTPDVSAIHSHVLSATYSLQIHHFAIYASQFKSFDRTGSSGLQFGVTLPFGRRSSVDVSASTDGYAQVQVQQSAAQVHDWGYQAYVSAGTSQHQFALAQYKSPVGLFSGGVDSSGGATVMRLESQGALSLVDRNLFPSNTIFDSFAIVDTSPFPHVRVLQENREVGSTGSSGRLLVPDMRSFELNHITIAATELPADVAIQDPSRAMRPQDRSGVVVKFPMKLSHGALLQLVDKSGAPIPLGSTARLQAATAPVSVGYDGQAYLEDLGAHNELTIERPDGRHCTVKFDYTPTPGDIPSIGPLPCVEQKP